MTMTEKDSLFIGNFVLQPPQLPDSITGQLPDRLEMQHQVAVWTMPGNLRCLTTGTSRLQLYLFAHKSQAFKHRKCIVDRQGYTGHTTSPELVITGCFNAFDLFNVACRPTIRQFFISQNNFAG